MSAGRYDRQMLLPEIGPEGQKRLGRASALIVGLGGLGGPVALYLAGAGVGRIGLADPDTVSLTNLHRQLLYDESSVGRPKVEAARERLSAINHEVSFDLYPNGLRPDGAEAIVAQYDLIIDCCDNYATRYLIDDCCAALGKPWIFGSISGLRGMVSVFMPSSPMRYADLFPDRDDMAAQDPASGAVIGPTPGVVGSIQAAEAIKLLAGAPPTLASRLLTINLQNMEFKTIEL